MEVEDEDNMDVGQDEGDEEENEEDSSDDEEIDAETQIQIKKITEKLASSPYEYQAHFDLIALLRKAGEFEKLRDAREEMAKIFPLTETLWLEWIEDEKKFADSEDDHERIEKLFERAVKDYMCPDIWLEYSQYCIRWMGTEEGMAKIRDVMERSLTSAGILVTKGAALWETYREFENAILSTLQPSPGSVPSAEQQDSTNKQLERVESLFRRQLAIPLQDMEITLEEFSDLTDEEVSESVRHTFDNAKKQLAHLMPFEKALVSAAAPKLEEYQNYIQHETKSGDPARIQCIYERALAENCLNAELWLQYLKYLTYKLKHGDLVVGVHQRSVRNCPWTGQLWVQYLLALERNRAPKEKLNAVFDEAILAGFSSATEYVELWRTKCEQVRRRLTREESNSPCKEELRECFVKATQYISEKLSTAFSETGDPDYSMWRFWARCEAGCLDDRERATGILQNILQNDADARRKVSIWREYYNIERVFGGDDKLEQCRSILRQAVQNCAIMPDPAFGGRPDAEVACEMLLDFERDFGSLEDMDESVRRITHKMTRVSKRREKGASAAASQPFKKVDNKRGQQSNRETGGRKRKLSEEEKGKKPERKNQKGGAKEPHEHPKRAKKAEDPPQIGFKTPSGLPMRYGKQSPSKPEDNETSPQKVEPPPGFKGPPPPGFTPPAEKAPNAPGGFKGPPPPGYKGPPPPGFQAPTDVNSKFDVNNNKDRIDQSGGVTEVKENKAHIESAAPEVEAAKAEEKKCTVFISNLDFKLQHVEERMTSVFRTCGDIVDIRLAKNHKGQFRGFGFLEFTDSKAAEEALKLDRQDIDGRPMFVSPNVDKRKQPDFKVFKYELGLEKHKLFISNLSFHTTEETLSNEFSAHGDIKSLRIVTNRGGRSKGLAYIEYQNEADAAQAVMKMDGKEIDGFEIQVAISNPPSRRQTPVDGSSTLGGGGGKDQFKGSRGRGRTQLSMMPRALHRPSEKSTTVTGTKNGDRPSSSGGMSNKDFAQMLLKK